MIDKIKKVIHDFFKIRQEYKDGLKEISNSKQKFLLQLPNLLTLSRPFSLLWILPLAFTGHFAISLILTGMAALTDFFDGRIARKYNAYSEYGKKLDPVCDKIFAIGLSLPILFTNPLLVLPTVILETVIASIAVASEIRDNKPCSTKLGKAKTWTLGLELCALYLYKAFTNIPIYALYPFIILANGMQIATSIQYGYIDYKKQKIKENKISTPQEAEIKQLSKSDLTHQQILEYQHLKDTLLEQPTKEKDKTKTIGTL